MASIEHFAQSYITNLYDKQQKKCQPIGGGGGTCPPPPPRSYATDVSDHFFWSEYRVNRIEIPLVE